MAAQMDIYECIDVATTGSDGKPPVQPDRRDMRITREQANRAAKSAAEKAIDLVETLRCIELSEDQWANVNDALVADFEEAIQETFADL